MSLVSLSVLAVAALALVPTWGVTGAGASVVIATFAGSVVVLFGFARHSPGSLREAMVVNRQDVVKWRDLACRILEPFRWGSST